MASYQTSVKTRAPIAKVFAFLADFSTTQQWDPGVVEARRLDQREVTVGSRFRLVAKFAGRRVALTYEISEFLPLQKVVLRAENAFVRSIDTMTFTRDDVAQTTTVSYDAQLQPKGLFKLFNPIFARLFKQIGDSAAQGLQRAVDAL